MNYLQVNRLEITQPSKLDGQRSVFSCGAAVTRRTLCMSISKDSSILQSFMRGGIDLGFRAFVHLSRMFLPTNHGLRFRNGS